MYNLRSADNAVFAQIEFCHIVATSFLYFTSTVTDTQIITTTSYTIISPKSRVIYYNQKVYYLKNYRTGHKDHERF